MSSFWLAMLIFRESSRCGKRDDTKRDGKAVFLSHDSFHVAFFRFRKNIFIIFRKTLYFLRSLCYNGIISGKGGIIIEEIKTVCFTGHRHIDAAERGDVCNALREEIEKRIRAGAEIFRTGGAVGFDTLAALTVLEAKEQHPHVRLELILPCPDQSQRWAAPDVAVYNRILRHADACRYVSPIYYNGVMQERNRALVDGSELCIAYLRTSHGGGSAYTAAYAIRSGLEFVNLADRVGW